MRGSFLLFSLSVLSFISCNTIEPTSTVSSITLSVENVTCTEAWIEVKMNNFSSPFFGTLKSNTFIRNIVLTSNDTILYFDSLRPSSQNYFTLNSGFIRSNVATAITMDTTSHNISWQKFEFGGAAGSYLSDVAIINENNIWAVGTIYLYDSLGRVDQDCYNAIHWDGNTWKVQRISAYYHDNLTAVPLNSICAFSAKDIWVNAGMPIHGDGTTWTLYHLWDMGILNPDDGSSISVWGTSSNDIYFGGRRGTLVHYDGQNWNKLVSGTTMDFRGIYGAIDQRTNKEQILAVTSYGDSAGREIRSIEGPNVRSISTYPLSPYYDFYSLWFSPDHHYYIAGAGIYEKKSLSDSVWMNRQFDLTRDEIIRIKGNDINDVFAVGAFGEVLHYNGITWKSYIHEGTGINGAYTSVAIKNNLVVIVGGEENKAIIQIGRR